MFLRVVILFFAATCCTALEIDVSGKQSAWERSGKFEGDIMLSEEQRNGMITTASRWPDEVVPYVIDDVFTAAQRKQILLAIDEYHNKTVIRFKEFDPKTDKDTIHITGENDGCWSYVGRQGGRQQLNLQRNGCLLPGTIIHELLHALGFFHQQSATERDDYVTIDWENIQPGQEKNFEKYNTSTITSFGVPYDYNSVMHYGPYAFSLNGLPTIVPKDPDATIGQRDGFSPKDLEKLAKMYEVSSNKTKAISSTTKAISSTTKAISSTTKTISSTTKKISSTTKEISCAAEQNLSYAPRSQFITLIIINLNLITHLQ